MLISHVIHCFKKLSTFEEEVVITSFFGGSVASGERKLAIDEGVSGSSAVPNLQIFADLNGVVREGEDCVRRAFEEAEATDGWTAEASEGHHGRFGNRSWR